MAILPKINFTLFSLALFLFLIEITEVHPAYPQSETSDLGLLAQVSPSVSLAISGGTNALGRRTITSGNTIAFGNIIYTQPELIANGDAFLDSEKQLNIEATLSVDVTLGGISKVVVDISHTPGSPNAFSQFLFSPGLRRSDPAQKIPDFPQSIVIKEIQQGSNGTIPIRVMGVVDPSKSGNFSDNVRIRASASL